MSTRIPDAELISRLRTIAASFKDCQMPTAAQTLTLAANRIRTMGKVRRNTDASKKRKC